jgi:hypothetical protein
MTTSGWFANIRAALELLFFISNMVIAAAVVFGLKQISLTKKIATSDARRESLKFAAERCQYYADKCVSAHNAVLAEQNRLKINFLAVGLQFTIVNKQIQFLTPFNEQVYAAQYDRMRPPILDCCNGMEAFAIPFAAGVADDELGFQETAASFCNLVEQLIGMIAVLRKTGARYESTLVIYERWKSRLVAQSLEGQMKQMQAIHRQASEKGKVKPADLL